MKKALIAACLRYQEANRWRLQGELSFLFFFYKKRSKKKEREETVKNEQLQGGEGDVLQIDDLCWRALSSFFLHLTMESCNCELGKKGLELPTLRLSGVYFNLLSYMPHLFGL